MTNSSSDWTAEANAVHSGGHIEGAVARSCFLTDKSFVRRHQVQTRLGSSQLKCLGPERLIHPFGPERRT